MGWEYRVVPFAPSVEKGEHAVSASAIQLQELIDDMSEQGFEYWRLETFLVSQTVVGGAVARLMGADKIQSEEHGQVAVFRRKQADPES